MNLIKSKLEKLNGEKENLINVTRDLSKELKKLRSLVEQLQKQAGLDTAATAGTTSTMPSDITMVPMLPPPPAVASASETSPREGRGRKWEQPAS